MFCMNFSHSPTDLIVHDVFERLNFVFVSRRSSLETDNEMDKNGQEGSCSVNVRTNSGERSFVFPLLKSANNFRALHKL